MPQSQPQTLGLSRPKLHSYRAKRNRFKEYTLCAEQFLPSRGEIHYETHFSSEIVFGFSFARCEWTLRTLTIIALACVVDATTGEKYAVADFDEPARELFIWSVLLNRLDMAMLFWDEGKVGTRHH